MNVMYKIWNRGWMGITLIFGVLIAITFWFTFLILVLKKGNNNKLDSEKVGLAIDSEILGQVSLWQ